MTKQLPRIEQDSCFVYPLRLLHKPVQPKKELTAKPCKMVDHL